jgi:hypothetical protein
MAGGHARRFRHRCGLEVKLIGATAAFTKDHEELRADPPQRSLDAAPVGG